MYFILPVTLPSVSIDEDTGLAVVSDKKTISLDVKRHPVATTFAIFDEYVRYISVIYEVFYMDYLDFENLG